MARNDAELDRLLERYELMHRIRAFEETASQAQRDGEVLGTIHPSIGQEAIAAGLVTQLRRDDLLLSTHRGHGHTMAKGADPGAMMMELLGKAGGVCAGKGGSMHIADFGVGMLGANGVVAANIVIAAGAAHALRLAGDDRIVCCIFGDGAINRGPFLEGLNWAKVYDLPVLFVCENNGFAATTRTESMTAGPGAKARAEAIGIPSAEIDGNDMLALEAEGRRLVDAVRAGGGPRFLLAHTYRLVGHTAVDPAAYRPQAEVEERWQQDPIARLRDLLLDDGVTEAELDRRAEQGRAAIAEVFEAARAAAYPDTPAIYADVQDVGAPAPGSR